jgi:2-C-methyl-D-erythritol 4-phosphate cytidylyltransferase
MTGRERHVVAILAAGGGGERLGADRPKAFVTLSGRPLLEWSLDVLRATCDRVVVAVPEAYADGPDRVAGADSRSLSVRNALRVAPEATVAVVHDAARPMLEADLVRRCIASLDGAAAAIAAAPVTDTIKQADASRRVTATLDRSGLWAVQTPQAFDAEVLREVLEGDPASVAAATDDAALVEAAGARVTIVEAPPENFKVTTALDLAVAEVVLGRRSARP